MIFYGLLFAFIGYAISEILMNDLLFSYKVFLVNKVKPILARPLGLCSVCFTGQLTLWFSLPLVTWDYVGLISWFGVISINMIVVYILDRYVEFEAN
jgi:hypothetical protein